MKRVGLRALPPAVWHCVLSLLLLGGPLARAEDHSGAPAPKGAEEKAPFAIPFDHYWTETAQKEMPKENQKFIFDRANVALSLARRFPPKDQDTIFGWTRKPELLKKKKFELVFLMSDDPMLKDIEKKVPGGIPKSTDAATMLLSNRDGSQLTIRTILIVDRLFFNEKGEERKDALTRTTAAVAHELYGNVQTYLEMDPSKLPKADFALRKKMEENAFTQGIAFLDRFQSDEAYKKLPARLRDDFDAAMKREKEGLESWKRAKE